jgi:hypothetical protein
MKSMKTKILAATLLALCTSAFATDVGVSVTVGQPGFYGRIDLGNMGPPPVVYEQPVIVQRPVRFIEEPLYLRVPPGHQKNWRKHCGRYGACGRNVYFVRDEWYVNDYAPRYRREHGHREYYDRNDRHDRHDRDDRREHHDRGHDRGDDHGPGRGDDHGRGDDKGHGNGHGKHGH